MKVLNLLCSNGHRFEGWFASEDDYRQQGERGQLECPLCADNGISRLPSAPRLNVSRSREVEPMPVADRAAQMQAEAQSNVLRAVRRMIATTEDVGERFPEEARRIHYGEVEERGIRGRATREEAQALVDEGIEVTTVSLPPALKGPSH